MLITLLWNSRCRSGNGVLHFIKVYSTPLPSRVSVLSPIEKTRTRCPRLACPFGNLDNSALNGAAEPMQDRQSADADVANVHLISPMRLRENFANTFWLPPDQEVESGSLFGRKLLSGQKITVQRQMSGNHGFRAVLVLGVGSHFPSKCLVALAVDEDRIQ